MIKLIKPYITYDEVEQDFKNVFESGWFTRGEYVIEFSKQLSKYVSSDFAFLTTSATTALWTSLRMLKVGPGDEVIVSDFSFPATVNVVEDIGATPLFADVSLDTYNMLPSELERRITARTKAVIFVDALGNPSGLHEIHEICKRHSIPLIEDAACALGSSEYGAKCGSIADLTCFSFHPRKLLTTGEGGAITLNNFEWAERLGIKLAHGADVSKGYFDFVDYGYNFRLSELQAVMGIKQLVKLDKILEGRRLIRDDFIKRLSPLGFSAQKVTDKTLFNVQSLVFQVPDGVDRDVLIFKLRECGIESTLGTYCQSATSYYHHKYNDIQPNSHYLQMKTITLPCYEGLDVDSICKQIRKVA